MLKFLKDEGCLVEDNTKIPSEIEIQKPIRILITHADVDHYNLIWNIFEGQVKTKDGDLDLTWKIVNGGENLMFIHPK